MYVEVVGCLVVLHPNHFCLRVFLKENAITSMLAAVMLQAESNYYLVIHEFLLISAKKRENYLVNEFFWVANHTAKYCSLLDCRDYTLLTGVNGITFLFDELNEVQLTYQVVDCFYKVLKLRFNQRVCTKERQIFCII